MTLTESRGAKLSDTRCTLAVFGLVVLAGVLRFYGLRWGLPGPLRLYSYHPDEFLTVGAAACVLGTCLPRFYNYPSLFIYLCSFAIMVSGSYGKIVNDTDVYLVARLVAAGMGAAAVVVTWWAGRILFGAAAGLVAALVICVAPLHVQHSHFATVDVPSTLFVAAALGFAGLVLKRGNWRDYILGGCVAGLAAGTKYNAAVVLLSIIAAHFAANGLNPKLIPKMLVSLVSAALAFVISTPGVILERENFYYALNYERAHAVAGHGLVFAGTGNGFAYAFTHTFWYGLGPFFAILFATAVVYAIIRRDKSAIVVLAFVLPYYVLISVSQVRFARYTLPLFPAAAVLVGWLIHEWYTRSTFRKIPGIRSVWVGFCVIGIAATFGYTLILEMPFGRTDPRDKAAQWIVSNVPAKSTIGVMEVPWFYSPPLSKNLGLGTLPQRQDALDSTPYKLVVFANCLKQGCWVDNPPQWVILSDYETADALRLRGNDSLSTDNRAERDRVLADLALVNERYTKRFEFRTDSDTMIGRLIQDLPHDMRYASPTLTIYELKR